MAEEKMKPDEEQEEKKPDTPSEEKKEEPPKSDTPEEKQEEKASDNNSDGDGNDVKDIQEESAKEDTAPDVPQLSESDKLKAENLTLKTQLEAMKIGFSPDCMEDAVTLAEAIVKRDGTDIAAALQAVAKKYPDWKADGKEKSKSGGFKVGADSGSDGKKADNDKLSQAFGIRKKK